MLKLKAYAKLDLAIDIEPKKTADGYYTVHYVDCQIDLVDLLTFEPLGGEIKILCDEEKIPKGRENFIWRVADLLKKEVGRKNLGAKITLVKNIPIKAGFGGGSIDGAIALLGLSKLFKVRLSDDQIRKLARELGKDFIYGVWGGLSEVIGEGKNYKVVPLKTKLPIFWLLVVVPDEEKPSTGWVYTHLTAKNLGLSSGRIVKLKEAIKKRDRGAILKNLTNDFEEDITGPYPIVNKIKEDLLEVGADATIMAGAGLSVVGFFESQRQAEKARGQLADRYQKLIVTRTLI